MPVELGFWRIWGLQIRNAQLAKSRQIFRNPKNIDNVKHFLSQAFWIRDNSVCTASYRSESQAPGELGNTWSSGPQA